MTGRAQVALLDGGRLHLHHGPIDIVARAWGPGERVEGAYRSAAARFATLLEELVAELSVLRTPIGAEAPSVEGPVARRMVEAALAHRGVFVTPMAAVAGAVADEVLAAMIAPGGLAKAYVDDGGDIAWHLTSGAQLTAGIVANQDAPAIDGRVELAHDLAARGLATSGWRGRSLSRGIADAVTVLASTAAIADVAATLIAGAVDAEHPTIVKRPANLLRDDTDLGDLLVTVEVGALPRALIERALARGAAYARSMRGRGLILAASLLLQGRARVVGPLARQLTIGAAQ